MAAPAKTVLVTGANGYIGNAVARAFVRAGWTTYGLTRSAAAADALAVEEIIPVLGSIDDADGHGAIQRQLPATLDAIISTTEDVRSYVPHYEKIIALLRRLALASTAASATNAKPLVIFTSGCKDYGQGPHFHGAPNLSPHTEESPLNPPDWAVPRATHAVKIFDHADAFLPVLVRPTNVHGRSSSYYRGFFKVGERMAAAGQPLLMTAPAMSITHSLHVDDCGDAYVALAAHPRVDEVGGQAFNIAGRTYETVAQLGDALAREYGLAAGWRCVEKSSLGAREEDLWPPALIDFAQWTGSDKLRRVTGWQDHRPLFTEGIHAYRLAYEAAERAGHDNVSKIKARVEWLGK